MLRFQIPLIFVFFVSTTNFARCDPLSLRWKRDHTKTAIFINEQLTKIPENLEDDTANLILMENEIKEIGTNDLKPYPCLQYLELNSNKIQTTDDLRGVKTARNLELLDLSSNELLTLDLDVFFMNRNLKCLIFDDNPFVDITGNIPRLRQLEELSLKNCNLTKIPWTDFRKVPNLKILDLRGNVIDEIPKGMVETLSNSTEVVMSGETCHILKDKLKLGYINIKLTCSN